MEALIQQYVRQEVSQAASEAGQGTFQEEDDFEVEEHDPLPMENYTVNEYEMADDPDMEPPEEEPDPSTGHIAPAEPPPTEGDEPSDNPP